MHYGPIYGAGITGLKGAFARDRVARLGEDLAGLYWDALTRPGGAVGRGTNRHYVEVHPEDIRGFVELVSHPWIQAVCEAVLGPQDQVVEIGFDVPNPGARSAVAPRFSSHRPDPGGAASQLAGL